MAAELRPVFPLSPVALIDREAERALLAGRLPDGGTRLLTLVGPPGVGKTTLAQHAAAGVLEGFADGAIFVALDRIRNAALVPATIARALALREQAGQDLWATLTEHLRERRILLVLDNFEHVIAAAAFVAELLAACPGPTLLVTSRTPLRLRSELLVPVEPLPLPATAESSVDGSPDLAAIATSPAVSLFLERAKAVRPDLALDSRTAGEIAAICRRLDGLPLAIELAAARARVLNPGEISRQLGSRLAFLDSGYRDQPARHQTLRAAIDWSYDLLSDGEQRLFRLLGLFAGGATVEAVEAVGAVGAEDDGDAPLSESAALSRLTGLVDQSLLRRVEDGDGVSRFRMLETVREHALERLEEQGEGDAARLRLAGWYLALAEVASAAWLTGQEASWLERLDAEQDNLRRVLQWAVRQNPTLGLRIAGAIARHWQVRGQFSEGRGWLEQLLTAGARAPAGVRALALLRAGTLADQQSAGDAAEALLNRALMLAREVGDELLVAEALSILAIVVWRRSDFASATAYLEESLAIAREHGRQTLIARCLNNLGVLATDQGQLALARERYEESLVIARAEGNQAAVAVRLDNLAMLSIRLDDLAQARRYAEEAVALSREHGNAGLLPNHFRRLAEVVLRLGETAAASQYALQALTAAQAIGNRFEIAEAYDHLARVAVVQGDAEAATAHARASLQLAQQLGTRRQIWIGLDRLGHIARTADDPERAVRLFAAAEAVRAATGEVSAAGAVEEIERYVADQSAHYGEEMVAAAWREGSALTTDAAIDYALGTAVLRASWEPAIEHTGRQDDRTAEAPPVSLSGREVEVLRLLAAGHSNGEIASLLVVSERTVEHHVANIYRKIDARGRVDATAFAHRHGLVR